MRRDAEANRGKLVAAGRQLLRDVGGDVAVERICAAAHVTRGTFYRNFADRAALYGAVLDDDLAQIAERIEQASPDPLAFLRFMAEMMMTYDRFMALLPDMPDMPLNGAAEAKILALVTPALDCARAVGLLDAALTGEDLLVATRMVGANWRLDGAPDRAAALDRRLALLLRGLGGPAGKGASV